MKKSLWTMAAALALVGCSQDQLMPDNPVVQNNGAVGANIFVPATSRGTALNSVDDLIASENGFDLFAYSIFTDGTNEEFMSKVEFKYDGNAWDYADRGEMKFWQNVNPGTESMKFFALSPTFEKWYKENESYYQLNADGQRIIYTVPENVAEQVDLMYAQTDLSDWSSTSDAYLNGVPLNFHHALSQIVFQARIADKDDGFVTAKIKSITVQNVHGAGTFYMDDASAILGENQYLDGELTDEYNHDLWNASDEADKAYTIGDLITNEITGTSAEPLTDGEVGGYETAMLLMPQQLTALDLSEIGDNVNSVNEEQFNQLSGTTGTYLKVSCRVEFARDGGTIAIVGDKDATDEEAEGYYADLYIPISTTWNPGFKYIYTLIFSADSGDPVKATVVSVDEWNSYGEDAPNSGDNDDDDDADDDDDEEEEETPAVFAYANGKILIKDAADLKLMGELINDFYNTKRYAVNKAGDGVFTVDVDEDDDVTQYPEYASADYLQVDNIDLEAYDNWTPIAQYATFAGSYDGNGYIIENLKISANSFSKKALFGGTTGNATLKNITIVSGSITNGQGPAAAIAGSTNGATITNCVVGVAGNQEAVIISGQGAAGIVYEAANTTFTGCINYVDVTGYSGNPIAGIACGSVDTTIGGNSTFIDCINYGDILSDIPDGEPYVAGISSDGGIKFINCHNYGNIESVGTRAAGIVIGTMTEMTIIACHNAGNITARNNAGAGICNEPYAPITLRGCYNTGKCDAGLIYLTSFGKGTFTMEACYNTGETSCLVGADTQFETGEASLKFEECYYTKCQNVFYSYFGWDGLVTDGATEFNDESHVWFGESSDKKVVRDAMNAILNQENDIQYQPNGSDNTKDATHPLSHPSSKE